MLVPKKHVIILKVAVYLFIATSAIFLLANFSLAANLDLGIQYGAGTGLSNETDIRVIIARVIRIALGFLGIISVGLIIYAGWLWMTSAGNEEKIERAKEILKNAVIGLIIILSAFAIASFILNQLIGATGGNDINGPGDGNGGGGLGAMGGEAVDYTFPANNQQNVPRNISQMRAVLNEPADKNSFHDKTATEEATANVQAYTVEPTLNRDDGNNQLASFSSTSFFGRLVEKFQSFLAQGQDLKKNIIGQSAFASAADKAAGVDAKVDFDVSLDGKTLILKPKQYLGSPKATTWYTVTLKKGILKSDGKTSLFNKVIGDVGYRWKFAVGTEIDNTPPKIISVVPKPGTTKDRNVVVRIDFSEAIDPTSASGKLEIDSGPPTKCDDPACLTGSGLKPGGFNNIVVKDQTLGEAASKFIAGNLYISNQYRTVEFLTINACGVNTCGQTIFCLPKDKQLKVFVKAATLAEPPAAMARYTDNGYDGVVDMAGNSLDGNGDGAAQGPASDCDLAGLGKTPICSGAGGKAGAGDNAFWSFNTNDKIDLTPPKVISITPTLGSNSADINDVPQVVFDKLLYSYSLNTKSIRLMNSNDPKFYYWVYNKNDVPVVDETTIYIGHNPFKNITKYSIQLNAGIIDNNQNCYMPCSGLGVLGTPSCCEGTACKGTACNGTAIEKGNCP